MSEQGPTLAEQARTALAGSAAATLLTHGCRHARTLTVVPVEDAADGQPRVWLEQDSTVVPLLGSGRVVSLLLGAPSPFRALELTGNLDQVRSDRPGHRCYRMSLLSLRFRGTTSVAVPVTEYAAATPDPLRNHAAAVLRHLEEAHAAELLTCVHAHGLHDVLAVVPRRLDRYGISLSALGPDGVRSLRLEFPQGPVDRLEDIGLGLRVPLTCRCHPGAPG